MNKILTCAVFCILWSVCGCSSLTDSHTQKEEMMTVYLSGDYRSAASLAEDNVEFTSGTGDELVWCLEAGSIHFVNGNYNRSIEFLDRASRLIEEYDSRAAVSVRDVAAESAVMVTNLNARSYRGFARDRIMIPLLRAFAYLGNGDEEGFRTELFALREAQSVVMEEYREFFAGEDAEIEAAMTGNPNIGNPDFYRTKLLDSGNSLGRNAALVQETAHKGYGNFLNPLGIFLSGFGYMRDGDWENAHVDFQRLYAAMPSSPLARRYYASILKITNREIPEELAEEAAFAGSDFFDTVLIICASGRGPALEQAVINQPFVTAWGAVAFYPHSGYYPAVSADGRQVSIETVCDMDGIFAQEYDELMPGLVTRIIISTLVKDAAVIAATAAVANEDPLAGALVGVVGTAYLHAMSTADTRSWEALPKLYGIAQIPMPGNHRISVAGTDVPLPDGCRSAIIYINDPGNGVLSCNILPFYQK